MRKIFRQIFMIFLRSGISIAALFFLVKWIGFEKISGVIQGARFGYLFISILIFISAYVLCFFRWCLLVKSVDIRAPLSRLAISYLGGNFFNLFLPSTVGGDIVRIADLRNHTKKTKEIAATVLIDRLVGFCALGIIVFVSIVIGREYIRGLDVLIPIAMLFFLLFSAIAVLFTKNIFAKIKIFIPTKRLKEKAENLHGEIFYFRKRPKVLLKTLLISFLSQVAVIFSFYFIFLALRLNPNIIYFFIFIPLISVIATIPVSIGGLGLRDTGSVFFFTKIGIAKDAAAAASLLNFFFIVIIGIVSGIIYGLALYNRWLQRH